MKIAGFFRYKYLNIILLSAILALLCPLELTDIKKVNADNPCVVVIDPGHGGDNLGANHNGYVEKEINMVVAQAMYDELLKYDNVEVYLTHTDMHKDMSLKERAQFAAEKNADFLFCLHFNMSLNHNMFGTEVYISAFDKYYSQGMSFAKIQIEAMEELGLYSRGIKTRLTEDGDADYYGIIRESRELSVTCALIEHCHLDNINDEGYYETDEKLQMLGRADATAAAKYLGLSSELLDVDYSDYQREEIAIPDYIVKPDTTDPDVCYIEELSLNALTGEVTFALTAQDYDSPMLYYSYSIDDGNTWSECFPWTEGDDTLSITIKIPSGQSDPCVKFCAYNLFDLKRESNSITYPTFYYEDNPTEESTKASNGILSDEDAVMTDSDNVEITFRKDKDRQKESNEFPFLIFLKICLIIAFIIFLAALIARVVKTSGRALKKRKRRRNNRR